MNEKLRIERELIYEHVLVVFLEQLVFSSLTPVKPVDLGLRGVFDQLEAGVTEVIQQRLVLRIHIEHRGTLSPFGLRRFLQCLRSLFYLFYCKRGLDCPMALQHFVEIFLWSVKPNMQVGGPMSLLSESMQVVSVEHLIDGYIFDGPGDIVAHHVGVIELVVR